MIKLFICPKCGWIRTVSRRSKVECFRCSGVSMVPAKLEYQKYATMNAEERQRYVDNWMYLHGGQGKS